MVTIQRQAYPAVRTTKEYDNVLFSFLRRHYSHQSKQKHSSVIFFFYSSLGQDVFLRRKSLPKRKRKKETLNVLLLLEKTRICNVRRTSMHFPTNKVDFVTNWSPYDTHDDCLSKRNSNDFRTESERLAYGSRPYMQFPVFGGRGGGGRRVRCARETLNSIPQKRLKITLSILYSKNTQSTGERDLVGNDRFPSLVTFVKVWEAYRNKNEVTHIAIEL